MVRPDIEGWDRGITFTRKLVASIPEGVPPKPCDDVVRDFTNVIGNLIEYIKELEAEHQQWGTELENEKHSWDDHTCCCCGGCP